MNKKKVKEDNKPNSLNINLINKENKINLKEKINDDIIKNIQNNKINIPVKNILKQTLSIMDYDDNKESNIYDKKIKKNDKDDFLDQLNNQININKSSNLLKNEDQLKVSNILNDDFVIKSYDIDNIEQDELSENSIIKCNKLIKKNNYKNKQKLGIFRPERKFDSLDKMSFLKNNIRVNYGEIKNYYEILIENVKNKIDLDKELLPNKEIINSLFKDQIVHEEKEELQDFYNNNTDSNKYKHFINADIRYLNLDHIVDKLGYFDIILMDPPWRIKGAQKNDSSFMFSNNKFCLEYNTMSNKEIRNIKIENLSKKGFIFLWILANQIQDAGEMLNKWGYELIDMIIWVKLQNGLIFSSQGFYFMHSYEICLIGYKCPPGEKVEYNSKISNNIIFAEVRNKSQKPEEIYEIIDLMMPGSKKVEIFARNNNLKESWFSIGNQLGEQFNKWHNIFVCNICDKKIISGIKRFKKKKKSNFDICEICWKKNEFDQNLFFKFMNEVDEDILHQYHECNICNQNPIWGIRFSCIKCQNYDVCEGCYDKIIDQNDLHNKDHDFIENELPILASGFPIHLENKCAMCYQNPIIGVMFKCSICPKFSICQLCYFKNDSIAFINNKSHKKDHNFELFLNSNLDNSKKYKCSNCDDPSSYKCENCFKFFYCEQCYIKRNTIILNFATSHKHYHRLYKINN